MAKNSRPDRRKWTAEKKIEILRSHFAKAKLIDTCQEFRVHPNLLSSWWKASLEAALPSLSGEGRRKKRRMEKAKQRYEEELRNKNEIIAELSAEILALKKPSGEI